MWELLPVPGGRAPQHQCSVCKAAPRVQAGDSLLHQGLGARRPVLRTRSGAAPRAGLLGNGAYLAILRIM